MDAREWLQVVSQEYLRDFIAVGGAAVKFVIPASDADRREVRQGLRAAAEQHGYLCAMVGAETTRIHLIDKLFHAVARQVDWDSLARRFLAHTLVDMGLKLPTASDTLDSATLAALNDLPEPLFLMDVRRQIWNRLFRDPAMSREFRLAMIRLCLAQLDPSDDPTLTDAVKQWLMGELRLISSLKRALIFQRIARHNARHMLASLTYWLHQAGSTGLVLLLDIVRYADASRPGDRGAGYYYSTTTVMDVYEVLRQLIDGTDELEYCFIAALADLAFLHDDRRGLRAYQALYLRVADDVRDRYRANPRAALVRVTGATPAGQEVA